MARVKEDEEWVRLHFRLPLSEKELLETFAVDSDLSMAQVIRKAIKYYMDYHVD